MNRKIKILKKFKNKQFKNNIIIDRNNNFRYNYSTFIENNNNLKNQKIISISPGGLQGFYLIGVVNFIKDNYNLDNYIYTGASAGAWSSLIMSYKYSSKKILDCIKDINKLELKSVSDLQIELKKNILKNFKSEDFSLKKIFIGVTVLKRFQLSTNIFYNFENLEDAIDCCIASSHIPILTGGIINKYNNHISFDGGFSSTPYLDLNNTALQINPNMWDKNYNTIIDYNDFIQKIEYINFNELYSQGYNETKKNKYKLDLIFKD
jgi:hypothetical protein